MRSTFFVDVFTRNFKNRNFIILPECAHCFMQMKQSAKNFTVIKILVYQWKRNNFFQWLEMLLNFTTHKQTT